MKLKKDEFKRSEIDAAGEKIKALLVDYVEKNKLIASVSRYSTTTVSITDKSVNIGNSQIIPFGKFIKEQFKIMDADLAPSHTITIHNNYRLNFYSDALTKLNKFEKIVLIKSMFSLRPSFSDLDPNKGFITENDFWLHLRNIAPFTKTRQKQHSDDVRTVLNLVSNRNINTEEKIDSLAYFIHYYKIVAKKTDIKAGLVRLLKSKVNEDYYPIFESLLSTKINLSDINFNIFAPTPEVKTLIILKDSLFEQVPFSAIPQAKVHDYNNYLESLNKFLQSPEISSMLNVAKIDYYELTATKQPARVYIQAKEGGFKEDIQEIYSHLVRSCADSFHGKRPGADQGLDKTFKTSLNYFLLNKAVKAKDDSTLETKRKVMKL